MTYENYFLMLMLQPHEWPARIKAGRWVCFVPFVSTRVGGRFIQWLHARGYASVCSCFMTVAVLFKVWKMEIWLGVTEEDLRNELSAWVKVVFT